MDKTKYKTLSIALEHETLAKLNEYCNGRTLKSIFVRKLIKRELNKIFGEQSKKEKTGKRIIRVEVNDYETLREYAEAKKLRNVKTFLPFAADRYMCLYPVKNKKKRENANMPN